MELDLEQAIIDLHAAVDRINLIADTIEDMINPEPDTESTEEQQELPLDIRGNR